ncbi:uncharacterized protein [Dermacentor albipictus]|uniref:uncharacterized protein isoform X3 n=1 Tax=Dermacentor albipictus TaxID=60249 RepID=UPI0038FD0239
MLGSKAFLTPRRLRHTVQTLGPTKSALCAVVREGTSMKAIPTRHIKLRFRTPYCAKTGSALRHCKRTWRTVGLSPHRPQVGGSFPVSRQDSRVCYRKGPCLGYPSENIGPNEDTELKGLRWMRSQSSSPSPDQPPVVDTTALLGWQHGTLSTTTTVLKHTHFDSTSGHDTPAAMPRSLFMLVQEGAEHPSASPARYEATPASNAKSSRKRSSDEAAGGSRARPKCSRPGSRASNLQPPSRARSLLLPDGYGRASEPPLVVVDDPASSSSTGTVSSQGGLTSGKGDDSSDGPDGLSRPRKAGGGSGQVSTGEGLTMGKLEDAMKKHLPEVRSTHSAAIQWIGAPHQTGVAGAGASPHAAGGPLPASTLLR